MSSPEDSLVAKIGKFLLLNAVISESLIYIIPQQLFGHGRTYLLTLSLLTSAFILWRSFLWPFFFSPLRNLPTFKSSSIIHGSFSYIASNPFGHWEESQMRAFDTVPTDFFLWRGLFNLERLVAATPAALRHILSTHAYDFTKPSFMFSGVLKPVGTENILFADGAEHKWHRRIMDPAFRVPVVKGLLPKIVELGRRMTDGIAQEAKNLSEGKVVDMSDWIGRCALDIIGQCGFEYDFKTLDEGQDTKEFHNAYKKVFSNDGKPAQDVLLLIHGYIRVFDIVMGLPIKAVDTLRKSIILIMSVADELVNKRVKAWRGEKKTEGKDILAQLVKSEELTDKQLKDAILIFLAAGHETTSASLQWAILELVKNPNLQDRLREEIHNAIPTANSPITPEIIDSMPLLRAFREEVTRFWPPIVRTWRTPIKDVVVEGQKIPKGTTIFIPIFGMNRSPTLWGPTAGTFDVDRWLRSPQGGCTNNYGMLTFLAGPRFCIGRVFAEYEFKVVIALLVGRFSFEKVEGQWMHEVGNGLSSKPKGGIRARVREIQW